MYRPSRLWAPVTSQNRTFTLLLRQPSGMSSCSRLQVDQIMLVNDPNVPHVVPPSADSCTYIASPEPTWPLTQYVTTGSAAPLRSSGWASVAAESELGK